MEKAIEEGEVRIAELQAQMGDSQTLADPRRLQTCCAQLAEVEGAVAKLYARREELEGKK